MSQGNTVLYALELVREQGFDVELVKGSSTLLTLDLDHDLALAVYEENILILQQHMEAEEVGRWHSKSGKGWHVIVQISQELDFQQRAGLQAMLGSDAKREILGYFNVNNRNEEPFVLFRPKGKVK